MNNATIYEIYIPDTRGKSKFEIRNIFLMNGLFLQSIQFITITRYDDNCISAYINCWPNASQRELFNLGQSFIHQLFFDENPIRSIDLFSSENDKFFLRVYKYTTKEERMAYKANSSYDESYEDNHSRYDTSFPEENSISSSSSTPPTSTSTSIELKDAPPKSNEYKTAVLKNVVAGGYPSK